MSMDLKDIFPNGPIYTVCKLCGREHTRIPDDRKLQYSGNDALDGWYFNCECKTTLFYPLAKWGRVA